MNRQIAAAITTLVASFAVHPLALQDESRQTQPGSPGSPKPTTPGQPQPTTPRPTNPTPSGADIVELRGEVVSLPEYFGAVRAPSITPGSPAPQPKEAPWGIVVKNDARNSNRDQVYLILYAAGTRGPDMRTTQETLVRGKIVERSGMKAVLVMTDTSKPAESAPSRTPGSPGSTPGTNPPR